MHFGKASLFFSRLRDHTYWILRRANAGFLSGAIAWFFIPALSRVLSQNNNQFLNFFATGLLGGAFLGSVDGMIEESTTKTIRGAVVGGIGGGLGGLVFAYFFDSANPVGFFVFWAIAGSAIGTVSAYWERQTKKIVVGILAGLIGGGVGGALGYTLYGFFLSTLQNKTWLVVRLLEGLSGGIIGVSLWFALGIAERFVIFKRRFGEGKDHKVCDHCDHKNPLNCWYCGACGSVLQVSAPAGKLNLSPYTTLDRIKEAFRFLGRLSATTGLIAAVVVFILFAPADPVTALMATIIIGGASYCLLVIFSAVAETLQIYIRR